MSEFPKSFYWRTDPPDVITFQSADEIVTCQTGMKWRFSEMERSTYWMAREDSPELTALRSFHSAVMQATQTESNSRLPIAIFAADAEVRRATPTEQRYE